MLNKSLGLGVLIAASACFAVGCSNTGSDNSQQKSGADTTMSSQNANSGSASASSTTSSTAGSEPVVRDYTNLGASDSASASSSDPASDPPGDSGNGPIVRNYTGGGSSQGASSSNKPTKSRKAELAEQAKYKTPIDMVKNIPEGQLVNPFDPHDKKIAKEGHDLFMNHGCSGCHGGDGGGGMCPPLIDDIWSYGHKPDTLFRLVTLGSKQLQAKYGLHRNAMQTMKADMPPMGPSFKHAKDLWKIVTWVESKHLTGS